MVDYELEQMLADLDPNITENREQVARDLLEKKKWEQNNPKIQALVRQARAEASQGYSSLARRDDRQTLERPDPEPEPEVDFKGRGRRKPDTQESST